MINQLLEYIKEKETFQHYKEINQTEIEDVHQLTNPAF